MAYKSLVTGGCGFIGRHLVQALRRHGDEVRILDVRPWTDRQGADERDAVEQGGPQDDNPPEIMIGSITDAAAVRRAMQGVDRVFHLAANPNLWAPDPRQFHEVNYAGTCRVLEEASRQSVKRVVYTSTESILKSMRQSRKGDRIVIDETARLTLNDMPGPYCRSKFQAEEAALAAAASGLPVVIVNPTMPLGPGDGLLTPPTKMITGFVNGTTPAYLNCEFNLVDARDAALGHLLAANHGRVGERYILGAENIELPQLLAELSFLTGRAMPRLHVPYGLALISAYVSEALANIRKQPPLAPITGVKLARSSMAFNCSKARRELGWQPRPLRQTLYDALVWLRDSNALTRSITMPSRGELAIDGRLPAYEAGEFPVRSWAAD
jgi:dihydroflavonol-4-reductase